MFLSLNPLCTKEPPNLFPKQLLQDQHIVVTGSSGLLGHAIATYCHQAGARVTGLERDPKGDAPYEVRPCDVTDMEAIEDFLQECRKENQLPDGWVHAAYPRTDDWGAKFDQISDESWDLNVQGQLNATCHLSRRVGRVMAARGRGSIVLLSSIYGVRAPRFEVYEGLDMTMPAPYAPIKGGIIAFGQYLAAQLGPRGVRINCVSPGGIFNDHDPRFVANYSKQTLLGRMGEPQEVASAVAFLLSDQSSYITGTNLMVDGGWCAR